MIVQMSANHVDKLIPLPVWKDCPHYWNIYKFEKYNGTLLPESVWHMNINASQYNHKPTNINQGTEHYRIAI